jgi:hypothetical protein
MAIQDSQTTMLRSANRATVAATAVLLLTTVHHLYGARVYRTPWRRHAAIVSTLASVLIGGSLSLLRRHGTDTTGKLAFWAFTGANLAFPIVGFGLFEGGYNHLVKDVLYFSGASPTVMRRLYPPPRYELPDNVFFEVTGVLQVVPAAVTAYHLYHLVRPRQ